MYCSWLSSLIDWQLVKESPDTNINFIHCIWSENFKFNQKRKYTKCSEKRIAFRFCLASLLSRFGLSHFKVQGLSQNLKHTCTINLYLYLLYMQVTLESFTGMWCTCHATLPCCTNQNPCSRLMVLGLLASISSSPLPLLLYVFALTPSNCSQMQKILIHTGTLNIQANF